MKEVIKRERMFQREGIVIKNNFILSFKFLINY